ncbi:hypothetical protein SAMN02910340_00396 [Methanosarcina thermophila]|jgi:hypothetical protein|uniref:SGNH/GDSL hydrolase family protein n=3 Tax=Methanosarcina thermophila TaxID=2210 RepID=A0A1I6XCQ2_METTE|nr:hypothetical protein [Methanosarcina thermophila]AKB13172.1 hypothetical protein MSTHT_1414 [Methanosarcina thermophila TM-1]AKB16193.1 hypothetical protein MSTHC_1875 [Methanosarcina thermophila CHTI-55]SFT36007.1 hypothetical protein SAMN02910340_00396 [Methanosarcina thermophila]BAW28162.1 conserved hypothetical protein [Methanosarcina thermophila]GLI13151.1 hypothetical protein MTHERMMSTA1_02770 [Methanosarcina thermophila MST-A1]
MNLVSKIFGIKLAGLLIIILFIAISGCSSAPDTESQSASENAQLADDTVTTTNASHTDENVIALESTDPMSSSAKVIYLHHSTGGVIWEGGVQDTIEKYNAEHGTDYSITPLEFPKASPYGWNNYPYDYWNIWVNHAGPSAYMEEPTLEMLTQTYDVIVWKHCFPVSNIVADTGSPDVTSSVKSLENYKLQYNALKEKMHEFPNKRFIVWTGAALVESQTNPAEAERAREFANWVKTTWDEPGDNIYVWDFRELETGGGLYLLPENAVSPSDSHPNSKFAASVAPLIGQRIIDVIEGRGDN